ncbi:MAG: glycosyltransferase family 39 protein [Anaerolineales bacterium]|nr:glycosyltransferase family 39 protein [Anaerolineales bacterium]
MTESPRSFFGRYHTLVLVVLFVAAAAIRIYDLTDLPLDFHPTRQLFSALKARGMYYETLADAPAEQRAFAIQQGRLRATIEPEILERLTVFTWKFTGEQLWIARIYSSLFWLVGGIFIYLLARDLFSKDGALFAAAFYLLLPYAVVASRSFQPDPLMVALIVGFWWAVNRWAQSLNPQSAKSTSWLYVLLASLLGGFAIFVKLNAAFFVVGGALGAAFGRASLRGLLRNRQVWAMAALGLLPGAGWVIYGLARGFLGQQFGGRFIPALLVSPSMYLGWAQMIGDVIGLFTFTLALLGLLLVDGKPARSFLLGLWGAYLAFALFFDYHISTHNYYSLPLVPIAALTLTPLADALLARLVARTADPRRKILAASVLTLSLVAVLWASRVALKSADYRPQAAFWQGIGETVRGHRVVALTQDYALPLAYWGWTSAASWPDSSDIAYREMRGGDASFEKSFARLTKGRDLFLVTDLPDLARQPDLRARLSGFAVFAQGDGFVIYDLDQPLAP